VRRRLHDGPGSQCRIGALEDAGSHEDGLCAELHDERRICGRGKPAGTKQRHLKLAGLRDLLDETERCLQVLCPSEELGGVRSRYLLDVAEDLTKMPDRSTTLPVPASPFDRIIAAPSEIRRSASPRLVAPHTNGIENAHLSMW